MRPTALFLDLDGTLLDYNASTWADTVRAVCSDLHSAGLADGVDPDFLGAVYTRISSGYFLAAESGTNLAADGHVIWRDLWQQALAECGCADGATADVAVGAYAAHRAARYALFPDAPPTLARLREFGLALVLITNGPGSTQRHKADATGLTSLLDGVIVSGDVSVAKPDHRIFDLAAEAVGVPPAAAWHVGDRLDADVAGARNAGLAGAVWLNRRAVGHSGDAQAPHPHHEISTLTELPGLLR